MCPSSPLSLTIVSPSFGQGAFIGETLQSIADQRYPGLQHVVADGGSQDGTLDVLREFASVYDLEWTSQPDAGLYDALNRALQRARGEWVGWINCDDLYPPGVLERVADTIRTHPDVDVVCGDAEVFRSTAAGIEVLYTDRHFRGERFAATPDNLRITHLNACFFRRTLLQRVGPFDAAFRIVADRDYMFRLMALEPRSVHLGAVTYRYRSHPDSLTMAAVGSRRHALAALQREPVWDEIKTLCRRYAARPDAPRAIRRWCRRRLARRLAREAAQRLVAGDIARSGADLREGARHHPGCVCWFAGALLRSAWQGRRMPLS